MRHLRLIPPLFLGLILVLSPAAGAKPSYQSTDVNQLDALAFYPRAFSPRTPNPEPGRRTRNVVVCIGDGMGFGQVALARLRAVGRIGRLHMETLPVQGTVWTYSADNLVTDSAAAVTALACGIKTNNKVIGLDPNGVAYVSLTEAAQQRGMRAGIVVTSSITHATPAGYGAHVKARKQETEIAAQLVASGINVLLGGGRQFFLPTSAGGKRQDGRDLLAEAEAAGYQIVLSPEALWGARGAHVLGLFQDEALETRLPEPTLPELTRKALSLLTAPDSAGRHPGQGFFLMVEGSQIDWACHSNHADDAVRQTLLFDTAVRVAVDFALADRETLVLVTADHETGGLIVGQDSNHEPEVHWTSKGHSAMPVPLFAVGPGAEDFAGVLDNIDIPQRIAARLGIQDFPLPSVATAASATAEAK